MKKLNEYKNQIHKCSKCGLCQSVCPIYQITGNDCAVSRGKFIMLSGVNKGDLKLNKNIDKYLDMCMKCNACKNFCPSNIDAREIFLAAKYQYFEKCPSSFFVKYFHKNLENFLSLVKIAANTYRKMKFDSLARKFYPLLLKFGWLGKKAILANEFLTNNVVGLENPTYNSQSEIENQSRQIKVVYFKGCVNEYINPRSSIATETILKKMGVEIIPINFKCCGVPFLTSGDLEQFKKNAEFNISQIPNNFDYMITDCASCQDAFKMYTDYITDENLLKKLDEINKKSLNVVDFVLKNTKYLEFKNNIKFTYHKPCHLDNVDFLPELLRKSKNLDYIEMKDFDKCCGFSGEFALRNTKFSEQISSEKAQNTLNTNADCVVTSCPSCILGLKQGMIEIHKSIPTVNIIELLALADFKLNSEYSNHDCNKKLLDAFVKKCF